MRRRDFIWAALPAALVAAGMGPVLAQQVPAPAVTPETASPDYRIQGEYSGTAGGQKLGAQVIAQGTGAFQVAFLSGGLPGDGWDGKPRVRLDGRGDGSQATFGTPGVGWSATVHEGTLVGQTDSGLKFSLQRVERRSPTQGLKPPDGAVVLFDGTNADEWKNGKVTADGLLEAGTSTKRGFRDFTLHLEFRTPFKPQARGQSRGNSGVYILGEYEVQILDSFGLDSAFNDCGALYRQRKPDLNMAFPPLAWQTYDIEFQAARFDEAGKKTKNAVITVRHNGVAVHDRVELTGPTGGAARRPEHPGPAPITIQNHGNPVHLRNIWIVEQK